MLIFGGLGWCPNHQTYRLMGYELKDVIKSFEVTMISCKNGLCSILTLDKVSYRFKSCEYIFLRTSSAQDLNSFSLFTKHGHGKRVVLENKNKRATRKLRISAGRPQCINRPRFLTFLVHILDKSPGCLYTMCMTPSLYCIVIYGFRKV